MRTIRVFIASSEELKQERLEIADVINNLNQALSPRDIEIRPVKWEYLDASMGIKHKQEEYNDALRKCDICIVLYWTKFGDYTETELNTAYQELCAGRNPKKLYVYFKDSDSISPQLKEFKDSFTSRYGHFFCRFANSDTMNLNFVLQVESFINKEYSEKIVTVNNGMVSVEGYSVAKIDNIPFASLNDEYNRLRIAKNAAEEEFLRTKQKYLVDTDDAEAENAFFVAKANKAKTAKEFADYQQTILSNALNFVRMSGESYTARMAEARELFDAGKISEADDILNFELLEEETNKEKDNYQQTKSNIEAKINEWILKASVTLANKANNKKRSYTERVKEAAKAYENAISLAEFSDYPLKDLSFLLSEQLIFINHYSLLNEVETNLAKQVEIERRINALGMADGDELSCALYNLALEMFRKNRFEDAEKYLQESYGFYDSWRKEGKQPMPPLNRFRFTGGLILLGDIHDRMGHATEAINYYNEAEAFLLEEWEDDVPPSLLAVIHQRKGSFFERSDDYEEAEKEFEEAVNIRRKLFNLNYGRVGYNSTPGLTIVGEVEDGVRIQIDPSLPVESDFVINLAEDLMRLAFVHLFNGKDEEKAIQEYAFTMEIISLINEDERQRLRGRLMNLMADAAVIESRKGNTEKSKSLFKEALDLVDALEKEQQGCYRDDFMRILGNAMMVNGGVDAAQMGEKVISIMEALASESPIVYYPELIRYSYYLLSIYLTTNNNEGIERCAHKGLRYYEAIAKHCPDADVMNMPLFYKRFLPLLSDESKEQLIKNMVTYYRDLRTTKEAEKCKTVIHCILLLSDFYRKTKGKAAAEEVYSYIVPYALFLVKDESFEGLIPKIYTDMAADDIDNGLYNYAYEKLQYALERYEPINKDGKYNEQIESIKSVLANFTITPANS